MIDFLSNGYFEEIERIKNEIYEKNLVTEENFIYASNGAKWTFQKWANRYVRTAIANDLLNRALNDFKEYDVELCFSSYLGDSSQLCINYQNKVYTTQPSDNDKYTWIEYALWRNGGGLIHPNCRHHIDPYFPGITEMPKNEPKKDIKAEQEARDEYLRVKNQRDKYYRRYKKSKEIGLENNSEKLYTDWNKRLKDLNYKPQDRAFKDF